MSALVLLIAIGVITAVAVFCALIVSGRISDEEEEVPKFRTKLSCPVCKIDWISCLETRTRANGVVARRYECAGRPGTEQHRFSTYQAPGGEEIHDRRTKPRFGPARTAA